MIFRRNETLNNQKYFQFNEMLNKFYKHPQNSINNNFD